MNRSQKPAAPIDAAPPRCAGAMPPPASTAGLRARAALLVTALLLCASACGEVERCAVPGLVAACACGDGRPGARVCQTEKTWRACDCSGAIALPNAVSARDGGSGASGGGGMVGGSSGAGAGGRSGAGGETPPPDDDDGGIDPQGGSGGAAAGEGGSGSGGATADGGVVEPLPPYRACATATDCDPGAECAVTQSFPTNGSVCLPPCVDAADCPVPEGNYEAETVCGTGRCRLDCSALLFEPLRTCPTGMICIAPPFGQEFCHAEEM
jgi:hypothetical protein